MVEGTQDETEVADFGNTRSQSRELTDVCTSTVKYDLVGDIAKGARLTRRTVVKILQQDQARFIFSRTIPRSLSVKS